MRVINGETRWYEGDPVEEGGRTARLILPRGREDAAIHFGDWREGVFA